MSHEFLGRQGGQLGQRPGQKRVDTLLQHWKRLIRLSRTTTSPALIHCLLPDDLVDHTDVLELVGVNTLSRGQLLAV